MLTVAYLYSRGYLFHSPGKEWTVPHHLAVGKGELAAHTSDRRRTKRILTESFAGPMERQIPEDIDMLLSHQHRAVEVEEQERGNDSHVRKLLEYSCNDGHRE